MKSLWVLAAFASVLFAATGFASPVFSPARSHQEALSTREEEKSSGISGIVTDQSGGPVLNAEVTLSCKDKNFERKLRTNGKGEYQFEGILPGLYQLKVEREGFRVRYFRHIVIGAAVNPAEEELWGGPILRPAPNRLLINVELKLGGFAEITVSAKAGPIDPAKTDQHIEIPVPVGDVIDGPPPVYPEVARAKGIEGRVELELVVSPEGRLTRVTVMDSTDAVLADAAIKAVHQWSAKPYLVNGAPVEYHTFFRFRFVLDR